MKVLHKNISKPTREELEDAVAKFVLRRANKDKNFDLVRITYLYDYSVYIEYTIKENVK